MIKRLLILGVAVVLSSGAFAQESKIEEEQVLTKEEVLAITDKDVVTGSDNAPVTIIEYASMSCSHCASFHNNTFDELKTKYIDSGKVKFIFRDFPLDEPALRGAMMARCAAYESDEKFLKFNKVMFSTQSNWAPKKNYLEVLSNIGKLGGMMGADFDVCIADKDLEHGIMEGKFNAAKYLEVRSTPSFFINGELHKGAMDIEYLSGVIDGIVGGVPAE